MSKKVALRLNALPPSVKAAITSVFAIVAFVIGAILENGVQKVSGNQPGDVALGLLWILIALIIAAVWGALQYWYRRVLEFHAERVKAQERALADAQERQDRTIVDARERITKLNVQHLALCDAIMEKDIVSPDEFRSVLICEIDRIAELIIAAWEVVNSHHNVNVTATERINFELTLITPSLRDSELTIASWCNRDNRRPKSLLLRDEGDKHIYQRTEAAKLISNRVTDTIVIEDTSAPTENYEALYEGQKARIRSSVLHPILSPKSVHLGVLVLHCDRTGFFRAGDVRYWHELFSVFAPSIALEIERIKAFNKAASAWPEPPIGNYQPY